MNIQKIAAYVLTGLGLAGIIVSSGKLKESIPIIKTLSTPIILTASIILIAAGILLLKFTSGHSHKQHKEVPIYEGKGKKRRIVGYQRQN